MIVCGHGPFERAAGDLFGRVQVALVGVDECAGAAGGVGGLLAALLREHPGLLRDLASARPVV